MVDVLLQALDELAALTAQGLAEQGTDPGAHPVNGGAEVRLKPLTIPTLSLPPPAVPAIERSSLTTIPFTPGSPVIVCARINGLGPITLVLDTGAPAGDSMVSIPGLDTPVSPGSTIGGCVLVNAIKAEVAARLTAAGQPPKVLTAGCVIGPERATRLFEAAYDEHARRLARLYNLETKVSQHSP